MNDVSRKITEQQTVIKKMGNVVGGHFMWSDIWRQVSQPIYRPLAVIRAEVRGDIK